MTVRTRDAWWSRAAQRMRTWWDASSYLDDVALAVTIITVGNSVMMVTSLDEPKTGTFAYVHLLGRLGIIMVLVGLFSVDELRDRATRWRLAARHPGPPVRVPSSRRTVVDAVLGSFFRGPVEGTARAFTAIVTATILLVLALAGIRSPAGGSVFYRNLVILAVLLVPTMSIGSRWWQRRGAAREPARRDQRLSHRPDQEGSISGGW